MGKMRIMAVKYVVKNGKKLGGMSFAFELDPADYVEAKTEATVRKRVEEYILKGGVFKQADIKVLKFSGLKDFIQAWKEARIKKEAEEPASPNALGRVTPQNIERLAPNEVFVFGSNAQGMHYGGAARLAAERFGAVMGKGHGMQGMSYAIDSMSGLAGMREDVEQFCEYAEKHPGKRFFVTLIGCGIAGYSPMEVAPLFQNCVDLDNVTLPQEFWDILGEIPAPTPTYDLERFVTAQKLVYDDVIQELKAGHKYSHWIWFIFPQQKGLGHSYNSEYYGLDGENEARAYLAHPVLGQRLRECCKLLLTHEGKRSIEIVMGSGIDVLKLQTSMNLFNRVSPNDIFEEVLEKMFD